MSLANVRGTTELNDEKCWEKIMEGGKRIIYSELSWFGDAGFLFTFSCILRCMVDIYFPEFRRLVYGVLCATIWENLWSH